MAKTLNKLDFKGRQRFGYEFVCRLPAGNWRLYTMDNFIYVACAEHKPRICRSDGSIEMLEIGK